jgi:hypothetical protein
MSLMVSPEELEAMMTLGGSSESSSIGAGRA